MEKHTVWELKQKQSLSLDAKIQMTRLRLKLTIEYDIIQ